MAIDIHSANFLRNEARHGLALGDLLTLGHQSVHLDPETYRSLLASLGATCQDYVFADDFFRALGAKSLNIMDVSDYEGANILHDLNQPISADLREKFDCVFDGGALEHVFNFPQALRNCMEMVKVGGHFTAITPTAAYCGHGFYQFSPELFYGALSFENGFTLERMLFLHRGKWYAVRNPAEIRERVELFTAEPTLLFICARRRERKQIFARWPQQSDYALAWANASVAGRAEPKSLKDRLLNANWALRDLQRIWREHKRLRAGKPSNQTRFSPFTLD
jgi:SAM-dependent methyltransferase